MKTSVFSRLTLILCGFIVVFGIQKPIFADSRKNDEDIRVGWAFGALVGSGQDRKLIPITQDTTLHTGDQIKMMIQKKSECFVYLIHQGPNGEIATLLSNSANDGDKVIYIPQGDAWFTLDQHTGAEKFYLMATKKRLDDLEKLLAEYQMAPMAEKSDLASQIRLEIKRAKIVAEQFAAKVERPIQIGGSIRGSKDSLLIGNDISQLETEITATAFYSWTITIDHQ
jgi:hypothetical protein